MHDATMQTKTNEVKSLAAIHTGGEHDALFVSLHSLFQNDAQTPSTPSFVCFMQEHTHKRRPPKHRRYGFPLLL
jgi:hypothetical protein